MDTNIITFLACICFIFVFGRIFILPLKKILKLIFNSVLGGVTIFVINLVGSTFGFHIGLNFFTSILIRVIRIARSSLFNCCEIINRVMVYLSSPRDFLVHFNKGLGILSCSFARFNFFLIIIFMHLLGDIVLLYFISSRSSLSF